MNHRAIHTRTAHQKEILIQTIPPPVKNLVPQHTPC